MRAALLLTIVLVTCSPLAAQPLVANPSAAPQTGIRQEGAYMTAPITLDGAPLFRIATLANQQPGEVGIDTRQLDVQNALAQLVLTSGTGQHQSTVYDPATIKVAIVPSNSQAVLEASDSRHKTPASVVTVTPIDAKYYGMTIASVAARWQATLQHALRTALLKRQPAVERRNQIQVGLVALALAIISLLLYAFIIAPLSHRARAVEQRLAQRGSQLENPGAAPSAQQSTDHQRRRRFLALALRARDPQRELWVLRAVAATLIWATVLVWFAALVWAFSLFPQTTPLAHQVLRTIIAIVGTWIGAGLLNRVCDLAIARIAGVWRQRHFGSSEERARELLRIPTFTGAISGFKTAVIVFIALLVSLGQVGVPIWSVVTFGGLTAIGITLAAQNFVRDFVNGFLVLFEDQYVVGDYVTINAQSGIVETLTLRMAQLRDTGGNLITIPHSSVTYVVNHSRNWSRVDYRVSIDPAADAERAMNLVRSAIDSIAHDEHWRGVVLEPLEWIGVESLSRDGVIIRASMKTAPLRQFELRRAINERVRSLFARAGIAFGAPVPDAIA